MNKDRISTLLRVILNIVLYMNFGFINMILILIGLSYLESYSIYLIFGYSQLNALDSVMLIENENNRMNVLSCMICEKFQTDDLIEKIKEKAYKHPRTRSKLIRFLGNHYWQVMTPEELAEKEPTFIKKVEGIHSEKDLQDFMAKEQQIEIELGNVQHRNYFIEDYNETQSAYVFKMQHCYADGLALVNYLYVL